MKITSIVVLFASIVVPSTDAVGFRGLIEEVKRTNKAETADTEAVLADPEDLAPLYGPNVDPSDQSFLVAISTDAVGFRGLVEKVKRTNKAKTAK